MSKKAELDRLTNELVELTPPDQNEPLLERVRDFLLGKVSNRYPLMDEETTVTMLIKEISEKLAAIRAQWLE